MPTLKRSYVRVPADKAKYGGGTFNSLSKSQFNEFATSALGLGNVSQQGKYIQALVAIYDIENFTAFSNQIDSHLVLPEFLKRYLEWFFDTLRMSFVEGESEDRVTIWGSLPFFVKFLGDGLLLIWDTVTSLTETIQQTAGRRYAQAFHDSNLSSRHHARSHRRWLIPFSLIWLWICQRANEVWCECLHRSHNR
jgi:hypothetical protein